ncbi:MAG: UDP-N-acetylglucosamine 2-epimerase, partial [Oscillospiraceae bacterium]|nr:UDP-N-acetylglucosamine 2-epimerase [Oscillospiraceae bacterium]
MNDLYNRRKRVCVVTGTRADYGLLRPLIARIAGDGTMELRLLATGSHLSEAFGYTCSEIESDGYAIDAKIEMLLSSDTASGMAKSAGLGMISYADYFAANRPDMLVVLGDRFEIFAAATAAAMMRVPIAHISGGDTSEGAVDEFLRHSITKMSALHFPSNEQSARRIIQMGESPKRVFNVGALHVECVREAKLLSHGELAFELGIDLNKNYILLTYHPETLTGSAVPPGCAGGPPPPSLPPPPPPPPP